MGNGSEHGLQMPTWSSLEDSPIKKPTPDVPIPPPISRAIELASVHHPNAVLDFPRRSGATMLRAPQQIVTSHALMLVGIRGSHSRGAPGCHAPSRLLSLERPRTSAIEFAASEFPVIGGGAPIYDELFSILSCHSAVLCWYSVGQG